MDEASTLIENQDKNKDKGIGEDKPIETKPIEQVNDQPNANTNTYKDNTVIEGENNPLLQEINRLTQMCYDLKKEGDELLKKSDLEEAEKAYTKAVLTVKELFKQNKQSQEELTKLINEVLVTSNSNLCVIDIKRKDWANCLRHANKVLHYDQSNVKARYRRCLSYIHLGKNEKADEDLFELEDLIGGTKELEELETLFEAKKTKEADEDGMIYKKMSKKLRNSELEPIIHNQQKKKTSESNANVIMSTIQSLFTNCLGYVCSLCTKKKKKKMI